MPDATPDLGFALGLRGKVDEAIEVYHEALRVEPDNAYPHHAFACFLRDITHDYEGAVSHFNKALELDPKNAYIHSDFGHTLRRQGSSTRRRRHSATALRLKPDIAAPAMRWPGC